MTEAAAGHTVKVHYTGTLEDGTQFDSSRDREPIAFELGQGKVIPGFENALIGMSEGDTKTVTIEAENAYGPRRDELVFDVARNEVPDHIEVKVGTRLAAQGQNGQPIQMTVLEVQEETVKLDANHPLAGKNLVFEVEMIEVLAA